MRDEEIQSKLLARLSFTLSLELPDDPSALALSWPCAIDGALLWDRRAAVELSQPAFDAALDAALWAYRTLLRRDGPGVPFRTSRAFTYLRGEVAEPPALQWSALPC
jgi:hypothetical protein